MNMDQLVKKLNEAAKAYYSESDNIMSDKEYDALYDELVCQEKETGIVFPDSPTKRVGYQPVSSLEKFEHTVPALSLDKTKEAEGILKWIQNNKPGARVVLSPKLDGLTAVAYYSNGRLDRLVTRGDGHIGEDVTHNAPTIEGIPLIIPYDGELIVRGEVLISYEDFQKINDEIVEKGKDPYQNPRNLASGSLRLLDPKETATRHLVFKAFNLANPYVEKTDERFETVPGYLEFLKDLGFNTVEYLVVDESGVEKGIHDMTLVCQDYPYPTDGLVFTFYEVDRTLGTTGKFPKHSIAFKWADETKETTLRRLIWSASKTGLINPIAEFDPVELEGTTVRRASVHNLTIVKQLGLLPGDTVTVYKSNMIIPQIDENLSAKSRKKSDIASQIPKTCPVCGKPTAIIRGKNGSLFLHCVNPDCAAKHLGKFERLVSRDGLNVVGLSTAILEQFLALGYLKTMADLFHLDDHKDEILTLEGFGTKSYEKMIKAVDKARHTTFRRMFYSLGIPGAGRDVAKILNSHFESKKEYADLGVCKSKQLPLYIMEDIYDELDVLNGIGYTLANAMFGWFAKKENFEEYLAFLKELDITDDLIEEQTEKALPLQGKTFVITGSVNHYANRNELKAEIESLGGKVSGSVSKKTNFLIDNSVGSGAVTSKQKKAAELGVKVITEDEYISMLGR